MELEIDEAFKKNITIKDTGYGFEVNCRKGLWGVVAPTKEEALREARHYFVQYFMDGEYSPDPITISRLNDGQEPIKIDIDDL